MSKVVTKTLSLSVDGIRRKMLEGVRVPPELINAALEVTRRKLEAKTTKFFSYQGIIIQKEDVEDHEVQLKAADQIYKLGGMVSSEGNSKPAAPSTTMQYDPRTGVISIIMGEAHPPELEEGPQAPYVIDMNAPAPLQLELEASDEFTPQIVRVPKHKRGHMPPHIKEILFGNE